MSETTEREALADLLDQIALTLHSREDAARADVVADAARLLRAPAAEPAAQEAELWACNSCGSTDITSYHDNPQPAAAEPDAEMLDALDEDRCGESGSVDLGGA